MKIGITGYSGFIGSKVLEQLLNDNSVDEIHLIGRSPIPDYIKPKTKFFYFDLVNSSESYDEELDILIHLGGKFRKTHVESYSKKEYFDANVYATYNLLTHVIARRFIYVSTVDVYGKNSFDKLVNENVNPEPSEVYALTKYLGEEVSRKTFKNDNLLIARLGNVFGPGDLSLKLIQIAISNIQSGRKIKMYGEGTYTRDYIFVDDAVSLLINLSKGKYNGIVNIVSGKNYQISEVLSLICSIFNVNYEKTVEKINIDELPKSITFDNSLVKSLVKQFNFTELSKGLEQTIEKNNIS